MFNSLNVKGSQFEIMEILWASKEPLSVLQIVSKAPTRKKWVEQAVRTSLLRLEEKKLVIRAGNITINHYSVTLWAPSISSEEYAAFQYKKAFASDSIDSGAVGGFLSALIKTTPNLHSSEALDELEEIIKQIREELIE